MHRRIVGAVIEIIIHGLGRQDHELSDRRVRRRCVAPWPCLHRPGAISAQAWTNAPARMAAVHVPARTGFATKPRLALAIIARAIAANAPFAWVAADTVYGAGEIETTLRRAAGKGYVLGVPGNHLFRSWRKGPSIAGMASEIAHELDLSLWKRLRLAKDSKAEGCTTGSIENWPISTRPNMTTNESVCGREAC
jgi:SRSO17 transposase